MDWLRTCCPSFISATGLWEAEVAGPLSHLNGSRDLNAPCSGELWWWPPPLLATCSVLGYVLLRTCILGTVSGSLLYKNSEATFLLEVLIQSWFTHVTTRFLQEQGLRGYFYNDKVDDYQVV